MVLGGLRQRFRVQNDPVDPVAPLDAPAQRPRFLAPLLLAIFFLVVVVVVVKMGGGEDKPDGGNADNAAASGSASPSATSDEAPIAAPGAIEGTVKSRVAMAVYRQPEIRGRTVLSADHGTRVMVECTVQGQTQYTSGKPDPTWARIIVQGKQGYVPVAQVDTGGVVAEQVPACT